MSYSKTIEDRSNSAINVNDTTGHLSAQILNRTDNSFYADKLSALRNKINRIQNKHNNSQESQIPTNPVSSSKVSARFGQPSDAIENAIIDN